MACKHTKQTRQEHGNVRIRITRTRFSSRASTPSPARHPIFVWPIHFASASCLLLQFCQREIILYNDLQVITISPKTQDSLFGRILTAPLLEFIETALYSCQIWKKWTILLRPCIHPHSHTPLHHPLGFDSAASHQSPFYRRI